MFKPIDIFKVRFPSKNMSIVFKKWEQLCTACAGFGPTEIEAQNKNVLKYVFWC